MAAASTKAIVRYGDLSLGTLTGGTDVTPGGRVGCLPSDEQFVLLDTLKGLVDLQRRIRQGLSPIDCGTPMADGTMSAGGVGSRRGDRLRTLGAPTRARLTDAKDSGGRFHPGPRVGP